MATPVNDLLAELRDALSGKPQTPEAGFRTVKEWGKLWKLSHKHACILVNKGVEIGRMKMKKFRILVLVRNGRQGARPVAHYAEVTTPAAKPRAKSARRQ